MRISSTLSELEKPSEGSAVKDNLAPAVLKAAAHADPIPSDAPVISTTLSWKTINEQVYVSKSVKLSPIGIDKYWSTFICASWTAATGLTYRLSGNAQLDVSAGHTLSGIRNGCFLAAGFAFRQPDWRLFR